MVLSVLAVALVIGFVVLVGITANARLGLAWLGVGLLVSSFIYFTLYRR